MARKSEPTVSQQSDPKPWQFKPGQSGNPAGRPVGSRQKLADAFLMALANDFETHGVAAIELVRVEKPDEYLKIIAKVLPKEVDLPDETKAMLGVIMLPAKGGVQ